MKQLHLGVLLFTLLILRNQLACGVDDDLCCYWFWHINYQPIPPDTPMRWVIPCKDIITDEGGKSGQNITHKEIIEKIELTLEDLNETKIIFNTFMERYSNETQDCGDQSEKENYYWLPRIPKKLRIPTDPNHLLNLEIDKFLVETYLWLQVVGMGMEEALYNWNLKKDTAPIRYIDMFEVIWDTNKLVMCHVWDYASQRKVQLLPDIGRSLLGERERFIESFPQRSRRNRAIFTTYAALIEYLTDVFNFLVKSRREKLGGVPDGTY